MSKRTSHSINTGQLEGAKIIIEAVQNHGLHESVIVVNRGTVIQPMSGWILASLRGQVFYQFPDDLLIRPGKGVMVYSGQQELKKTHDDQAGWVVDLLWTTDQVWNNHGDTAILFDANDLEIDRHSYPHERVLGSSANRRKGLIRSENGFEIVDESLHREKQVTRKKSGAFVGLS